MNEYTCTKCGAIEKGAGLTPQWYHLQYDGQFMHFCCRTHVIEYLAPELQHAVVVKQWVPTPEETERMGQ